MIFDTEALGPHRMIILLMHQPEVLLNFGESPGHG